VVERLRPNVLASNHSLSGGYDQTCKTWDIEQGKLLESFDSEGFVQCVKFAPSDNNLFFSGTSRNVLCMYDRREGGVQLALRNNSMVNTIAVSADATTVVSGDATGYLKTWDIRTGKCIHSLLNENSNKPISHISCCPGEDEDYKIMAVNSYDNVMRVYERTMNATSVINYKLMHALKGYKNRNWPIRSSFFSNRDGISYLTTGIPFLNTKNNSGSSEDIYNKDLPQEDESSFDRHKSDTTSLLATGSADPFVYIYSLGQSEVSQSNSGNIRTYTTT
jgi:COMPASS component SWD3